MHILKVKTKILIKQKNDSLNFLFFEGIFLLKKKIFLNENFNFLLKKNYYLICRIMWVP
jgi:hypothetical protein